MTSTVGIGTVVEIVLPAVQPPVWFKSELTIPNDTPIIVLDDEPFAVELWKRRLPRQKIRHFRTSHSLIAWYSANSPTQAIFLCDFDLKREKDDGLTVIETLGIGTRSVLVTGHYGDAEVRRRCMALGVQIIPKEYIPYVPVSFEGSNGKFAESHSLSVQSLGSRYRY